MPQAAVSCGCPRPRCRSEGCSLQEESLSRVPALLPQPPDHCHPLCRLLLRQGALAEARGRTVMPQTHQQVCSRVLVEAEPAHVHSSCWGLSVCRPSGPHRGPGFKWPPPVQRPCDPCFGLGGGLVALSPRGQRCPATQEQPSVQGRKLPTARASLPSLGPE